MPIDKKKKLFAIKLVDKWYIHCVIMTNLIDF